MIGVWVMCTWEQMGRPKNVNLIELGPGRGTLLADLLRVRYHYCFNANSMGEMLVFELSICGLQL